MAPGSKRRKRPLKGLLAWVGLAVLALVAAKKAVGRLMRHEAADEEAGSVGLDAAKEQAEGGEQAEGEGPESA